MAFHIAGNNTAVHGDGARWLVPCQAAITCLESADKASLFREFLSRIGRTALTNQLAFTIFFTALLAFPTHKFNRRSWEIRLALRTIHQRAIVDLKSTVRTSIILKGSGTFWCMFHPKMVILVPFWNLVIRVIVAGLPGE